MLLRWPLVLILLLAACELPRDADGASERVTRAHELRVGVTDNPPWVDLGGPQPAGIEPELVRQLASRMEAKVVWTRGSETHLVQRLEDRQLDLALGGFNSTTTWKAKAGVTQPFATTPDKKKHVFLTAPGENALLLAVDKFLVGRRHSSAGGEA